MISNTIHIEMLVGKAASAKTTLASGICKNNLLRIKK